MSGSSIPRKDIPNAEAHAELYHAGLEMRKKVLGEEYVTNQLSKNVSEFAQPMQQLVSEIAWGSIWTRPGLELKQRSLINIALLASKNFPAELSGHIRGAVNNGATEVEIRETLLQTAVYCGAPVGMSSFRVADATIQQLKEEGKLPK
ncbi:hypothetical protein M422DRAFT_212000 [Sphaerobolus stellatus SS14]|uniref:Carboxymuconolactone decarboxylase-like domain-containing protein n=1 Tax=Sphaerobolus stellatus (strain SS14) TaxID=990650 RepID=A0A0C9UPK1_SPHS4|nr:hypothetical protein M422DRAFT_273381 [Sphaerobolus stellatus SS14]KIJ36709.1 hypothetical protein M422DRAFT_212000 [Sphaerobolus stellatus SS14]